MKTCCGCRAKEVERQIGLDIFPGKSKIMRFPQKDPWGQTQFSQKNKKVFVDFLAKSKIIGSSLNFSVHILRNCPRIINFIGAFLISRSRLYELYLPPENPSDVSRRLKLH